MNTNGKHKLTATRCLTRDSFVNSSIKFVISSTLARLKRGFIFPLIMFILNVSEYIQLVFFLSYGTLADFVKTIDSSVLASVVLSRLLFRHARRDCEISSLKNEALYALRLSL